VGQRSEEQLTSDIEETRQDLSRNLDALNEKVNPVRVVERKKEETRVRFRSVKDRVMGSAQDVRYSASSSTSNLSGNISDRATNAADTVTSTASSAVGTVQSKAEGNPLAAGVIAFGAGWLISSLLPASQREAQAAQKLVETAKEHGQPLVDEAKSVGQQIGDNLKGVATEAAQEVKATAQDSAETVKQEGQSSAQSVKQEGQQSAQTVKGQAPSSGSGSSF